MLWNNLDAAPITNVNAPARRALIRISAKKEKRSQVTEASFFSDEAELNLFAAMREKPAEQTHALVIYF